MPIDNEHEKLVREEALRLLLERHSVSPKHLSEPGATDEQLSGGRAKDPMVAAALCESGETLVGRISSGTATVVPKARGRIGPGTILRRFQRGFERT